MKNASHRPIGFYIGNMNRSGGTERVLSQISNELIKRGWKVCIINMYGKKDDTSFYPFSPKIKKIWLLTEYPASIRDHIKEIAELHKCLKKEKFSAFIELDLILSIYSAPARIGCGVRMIAWEHFNFYYQYRKHNRLHRFGMVIAACNADRMVVLTKEDEGYYKRHFPWLAGRIRQIYNPNSYELDAEEVPDFQSRKPIVFAAGRLTPAKGFAHLIRSWELLEEEFPEWELVIAGEGELRQKLEQQIRESQLERIHLPGNLSPERMKEFYSTASVFAFSSIWEGFGMVLTEAMNYGMPSVANACIAGPSEIVENLKSGFLVKTGDEVDFAAKLRILMQNPILCKRMGTYARESCKRFDLNKIVDEWEEFLDEVGVEK